MDTATKFWRAAAKITLCFLIVAMLTIALFPALFAQAQTVEVGVPVEERANLFQPAACLPGARVKWRCS